MAKMNKDNMTKVNSTNPGYYAMRFIIGVERNPTRRTKTKFYVVFLHHVVVYARETRSSITNYKSMFEIYTDPR